MEIIGMNNLSKSFGHLKVLNWLGKTEQEKLRYSVA